MKLQGGEVGLEKDTKKTKTHKKDGLKFVWQYAPLYEKDTKKTRNKPMETTLSTAC